MDRDRARPAPLTASGQRPRLVRATTAVVAGLLAAVVVVDVLAVRAIVRSRRQAAGAAHAEVARRVELDARTLEASLARARADLAVLAAALEDPSIQWVGGESATDPVAMRRRRLEVESAMLLFAVGHPILDELRLAGPDGAPAIRIGRAGAEPLVLAPTSDRPFSPLEVTMPAVGGELAAWSGATLPSGDDGVLDLVSPGAPLPVAAAAEFRAAETLSLEGWTATPGWRLVRSEPRRVLLEGVEALAAQSRLTVLLNLALIPLSIGLGWLAVASARRSERLAIERTLAAERAELERHRWHTERLASVGRLAAGIAHEINNPLAGSTTWLSLLEEDLASGELDRAAATAGKLRHGLERIRDIVGRTLTFADPGRGEPALLDLRSVVAETVAFVADVEKECELRLLPATEGAVAVRGDRPALGQLVLNLLLNAVQIQGTGGVVEIEVSRAGAAARLVVADRGPGIAEALQQSLFEPFVSGRGSTGLGLAMCHGIVSAHGGSITGENRPDGGARFVVLIPRAEEAES